MELLIVLIFTQLHCTICDSCRSIMYGKLEFGTKGLSIMATNRDSSRSSLLAEQYQHDMELITVSLLEEDREEREERLSLVARSWSLTCACFHTQLESSDAPLLVSQVALARR